MPEVFNLYGFSFFFYSREHSPIHIHVQGAEGEAKFELIGEDFVYGVAKQEEVTYNALGELYFPMSKIEILNTSE